MVQRCRPQHRFNLTKILLKATSERPDLADVIGSNFLPECSLHASETYTTSDAPESLHLL